MLTLKQIEDQIEQLDTELNAAIERELNARNDQSDLRHRLNALEDARRQIEDDIRDEVDHEDSSEDDGLTDAEADAMTLASAGMGTDEDYGYFGDGE